jgi:hypothetical protein
MSLSLGVVPMCLSVPESLYVSGMCLGGYDAHMLIRRRKSSLFPSNYVCLPPSLPSPDLRTSSAHSSFTLMTFDWDKHAPPKNSVTLPHQRSCTEMGAPVKTLSLSPPPSFLPVPPSLPLLKPSSPNTDARGKLAGVFLRRHRRPAQNIVATELKQRLPGRPQRLFVTDFPFSSRRAYQGAMPLSRAAHHTSNSNCSTVGIDEV